MSILQEIDAFITEHERTVVPLYADYNRRFWELSTAGNESREKAAVEAKQRYLNIYANKDDFRRLKEWKTSASALPEIAGRQFKLIYDTFVPYQMDEKTLHDIVERETDIENQFNTFRADFEGTKASDNQLRDVLRDETDIRRRQSAWEAGKKVGHAVAPKLLELIHIRNREARALGYPDYYAMMFELQELDEHSVFSLFDRLDALSSKAFSALKNELDATLKKRYGITDAANYPWQYADPFFQEFPSAGAGESLDGVFKGRDIQGLTRAHYESIGLNIDDLLSRADLYEREAKSQHAFCLDVDHEGDVRVLCNIRDDERWMSTMLHEFGHAVYDKYHDRSLPFLLRSPAHILTTEAVAMLNGRMSKDPGWLMMIAGLSDADAKRLSSSAQKILRSEMLIFLRWAITLVRFERELYRDPGQNLNRLWWEYVERYQMITPPPNRDLPDWAAKNHLATSPVYYQNYVLGELMASQLFNFVQNHVVKSGGFVGHPQAGTYLVDTVFKPGSRYTWNEMLRRGTGEDLNADYFVRQFV